MPPGCDWFTYVTPEGEEWYYYAGPLGEWYLKPPMETPEPFTDLRNASAFHCVWHYLVMRAFTDFRSQHLSAAGGPA